MEHLPTSSFTREQKIGFIFMLVFAILTVGLGALQLRNTIYGPFVIKKSVNPFSTVTGNDEARLKSIDTDHDEISDFDELNQYETSPYLPDTDSDGTDDKTEIDRGTDPLCPEGNFCENESAAPETASSTPASPLITNESLTPENVLATTQELSEQDPEQSRKELEQLIANPAELRLMLLKTGKIDQATLEKIDDATLQKVARELFFGTGSGGSAEMTATTSVR